MKRLITRVRSDRADELVEFLKGTFLIGSFVETRPYAPTVQPPIAMTVLEVAESVNDYNRGLLRGAALIWKICNNAYSDSLNQGA